MDKFDLKKYLTEGKLYKEEIQNEIFGIGKHDFEKLKFSRDGFTANARGGVLYITSDAVRTAKALGPFKLTDGNRSFDISDRNTKKLIKKVQGFDRYTRRRIREALRDAGVDGLATAFADGSTIKSIRK